jgi:hypothetical protein
MIPLSLIFLNGWYFTKHEHHGLWRKWDKTKYAMI